MKGKKNNFLNICILCIALSFLTMACVPLPWVISSNVPEVDNLPQSYFESGKRVLVLPMWFEYGYHNYYEQIERGYYEGHYYLGKPRITNFRSLKNINQIIPSKTSAGLIGWTGSTSAGWTHFAQLYLIVENGLAIFMGTKGFNEDVYVKPDSWGTTIRAGWIGPQWKISLKEIVLTDQPIDYAQKPSDFILIRKRYREPYLFKNNLADSDKKKILEFLEKIDITSDAVEVDVWHYIIPKKVTDTKIAFFSPDESRHLVGRSVKFLEDTKLREPDEAIESYGKYKFTASQGETLKIVKIITCRENRYKECWVLEHNLHGQGYMRANNKLLSGNP